MLKGIPDILSPELLKILMEMGHGDEIVIADGNFPKMAHGENVVRLDAHGVCEILEAVLKFFPLDPYVENPVTLMEVVKGDDFIPVIWDDYKKIIKNAEGKDTGIEYEKRFEFYDRAAKAYATVATGEKSLYANIILKKGVVK